MMMSLGQFVFSLPTLAYQDLRRASAWRHPSNSRVGARPARQFVGPGDDCITLGGLLVPEFMGSRRLIDELRAMAEGGKAWALVDGAGEVLGAWVIESINESGSHFIAEGQPRRIEFELQLARVDDDQAEPDGGWGDGWDDYWDWWM